MSGKVAEFDSESAREDFIELSKIRCSTNLYQSLVYKPMVSVKTIMSLKRNECIVFASDWDTKIDEKYSL